jgi:AcrR family transcriptional regulator
MSDQGYMRIKELSMRSGVPRTTIQYYLRERLLHPPTKTGRTMAYYDKTHLQELARIGHLKKELRMPIAFLKRELARPAKGNHSKPPPGDELENQTNPKDIRKSEIVKAAIEAFSKKGYHRTKVSDVTKEAGISTGTFYIYFENKRELFIEVVEDVFRHIVGDAAKNIKGEENLGRKLVIRGRTFYENYSRYMEILNQLRAEIGAEDWAQEKLDRMYRSLTGPVIREAQEAIDNGELRPVDPELLSFALTGLIEVMSFRISLDDKYTIEDAIGFIADMIINGLIPEQDRDKWDINRLMYEY